jgi:hypothetical protein
VFAANARHGCDVGLVAQSSMAEMTALVNGFGLRIAAGTPIDERPARTRTGGIPACGAP